MSASSWARTGFVIVIALVFQLGVLDQIPVLGVHADFMILFPAAAGLVGGPQRGAMVGFVAGLGADLTVNTPFGLSALTFVLVGYGLGAVRGIPRGRETDSAEIAACTLAGAVGTALYAIIGALIGQPGMLSRNTMSAILVVALGAVVLSYPALRLLRWSLGDLQSSSGYAIPSGGSATG